MVKIAEKKCGLCGKKGKLIKTECCDEWICDDQDSYQMFSFSNISCSRNHQRYTLCGYHHTAGHSGNWQDCQKCKDNFGAEMYSYYATNDYNNAPLENPPKFDPTYCSKCNKIIKLGYEPYSQMGDAYTCNKCFSL